VEKQDKGVEKTPKQKRTQDEKTRALRKAREEIERRRKANDETDGRNINRSLKAGGYLPYYPDRGESSSDSSD
jgi:hypothetical protein